MSKSTGQKFGRAKRRPSHANQAARTAANRERRIAKSNKQREQGSATRGVTRRARREHQMAIYTPRNSEEAQMSLNQRIAVQSRV